MNSEVEKSSTYSWLCQTTQAFMNQDILHPNANGRRGDRAISSEKLSFNGGGYSFPIPPNQLKAETNEQSRSRLKENMNVTL